jgi:hypothetical protein
MVHLFCDIPGGGYDPISQFHGQLAIVPSGKLWRQRIDAQFALQIFVPEPSSQLSLLGPRCGLEELAEPLDPTPQLGRRLYTHLVHDLAAMRFDRALGDAEDVSDLLIR